MNISDEMRAKIRAAQIAAASQNPAQPQAQPPVQQQATMGPVTHYSSGVTSRAIYMPGSRVERGGMVIAAIAGVSLMLIVWILNGLTNVVGVAVPLYYSVRLINACMRVIYSITGGSWQDIALQPWVVLTVGVLAHVGISTIEQHLWRARQRGFLPLIVFVGSVDVLLAALAIQYLFKWYDDSLFSLMAMTALGEGIALGPEPTMVKLSKIIRAYWLFRRG